MNWREQAGQRLMIGLEGREIDPEFERLVREYKIGNVILFQRNIGSMSQVRELCESIQELVERETGHRAFIAIDQEGGMVTRLPGDGCNVPGAMAVSATGCAENAEMLSRITAKELKGAGINFNLAPVMDINNNPENPVIGVRSYGDRAETVIEFGTAAFRGYRDGGILSSAKHFPGYGDTAVDAHVGLPVIEKSLEELEALELKPFRAIIEEGIPAVMTGHVLFPQLEPEQVPCTMSRRFVTGILREKLGFEGLVVSDCMEMDAIQKYYGTAKGIVAAMAAGVDIVLVSRTVSLMEEGILAVHRAVEDGTLSEENMRQAEERIIRLKEEYIEKEPAAPKSAGEGKAAVVLESVGETDATVVMKSVDEASAAVSPGCTEEDREKAMEIRRKSIVFLEAKSNSDSGKNFQEGKAISLGKNPFFTGCAGYRASLVLNEEPVRVTFAEFMAGKLGGIGFVTSRDPGEEEIARAAELARGASSVVMCVFDGRFYPGQRKLLQELTKTGAPVLAVALHNPYDMDEIPDTVSGIVAWDNSEMSLEVLAELFRGEWIPSGKMPIALRRR